MFYKDVTINKQGEEIHGYEKLVMLKVLLRNYNEAYIKIKAKKKHVYEKRIMFNVL